MRKFNNDLCARDLWIYRGKFAQSNGNWLRAFIRWCYTLDLNKDPGLAPVQSAFNHVAVTSVGSRTQQH